MKSSAAYGNAGADTGTVSPVASVSTVPAAGWSAIGMPFGSVAASLRLNGDAVLRHGYDGVLVHEAMIFERQEGNSPDYPHLCELTKRLK